MALTLLVLSPAYVEATATLVRSPFCYVKVEGMFYPMPRKSKLSELRYLEKLGEKPAVIRFFRRRTDGAIIYDVLYANRQVVTGRIVKEKFEKWLNH